MAIIKSAKKAFRQSQKRRVKNLKIGEKIRRLLKETRSLISAQKIEEAKKILPRTFQVLDKAAKVGLLKKNTVNRKKSRLAKQLGKTAK
ncbi:MAG: 30S ribosomal protein S20 [Candidatus Nealsonbacteria bacterium]|nr:30S ribosomal protein S20 [Candidatus Nealsonbacteria bacterium]